jgi:hypothetical protein
VIVAILRCALALGLLAGPAGADTIRVATYGVDLARKGPGLLLRDLGAPDAALSAVAAVIRAVRPDVLLVTGFDHDLRGRAIDAFRALLAEGPEGIDYPFAFNAPVNAGVASGLDLDGDGLLLGPDDALGWGRFPGNGGTALLSRLPIDTASARSFRELRWAALPGATLPALPDGSPFPSPEARAELRLSSRSHWDVPVVLPGGGRLHLLAANPTPPLFDGPEERNRRRNRDEVLFWAHYLDGMAVPDDQGRTAAMAAAPFVILGDLNADPFDGAGLPGGVERLLAHPALRDPAPASAGAREAAHRQGGANARHAGPAALDTADWRDEGGPGNLRVDYVLPSAALEVHGAGVFWPAPGDPMASVAAEASAHRLVWVDLRLP